MTDTKFTPGPWSITKREQLNLHVYRISGRGVHFNSTICNTAYWEDSDCFEESKANAHLIAAAPELYDALQKAIDLLASAEIQESVRVRGMTKIIRDGDKALKKSRGES